MGRVAATPLMVVRGLDLTLPGEADSASRMDWDELWRKDRSDLLARGPSARARLRVALGLVRSYGRDGGSLLDVGCGAGLLLEGAAALGRFGRIVGADISEVPLELARVACPSCALLVADICMAPLAERFSLITCMMMLDLVADEERAAAHLAEMLEPGGYVIAVVQHLETYRNELDDRYGVRRHDRASLTSLFRRHGLEPARVFAWGWPVYDVYYRAMVRSGAGVIGAASVSSGGLKVASLGLSALFRVDDLFTWTAKGRVLFGVFEKPAVQTGA